MSAINNNVLILPVSCNIFEMKNIRSNAGQAQLRRCFNMHIGENTPSHYFRTVVFSQRDSQFYGITLAYRHTTAAGNRYDFKILPLKFNTYPIADEWLVEGTTEDILDWDLIRDEEIDDHNFNGSYWLFYAIYDDTEIYFNDFYELHTLLDSFNLSATGNVISRPSLPLDLINLDYLSIFDLNSYLIHFIIPLEPTSGERAELNRNKADLITFINNNFIHPGDSRGVERYIGQDVVDIKEDQHIVTPHLPDLQPVLQ